MINTETEKPKVLAICDYIHKNHSFTNIGMLKWKLISIIDRFPNRLEYEEEDGVIRGATIYIKADYETIKRIMDREINIRDYQTFCEMLGKDGNYIQFVIIAADGIKYILKGLRRILEREKPIAICGIRNYIPEQNREDKDSFITIRR